MDTPTTVRAFLKCTGLNVTEYGTRVILKNAQYSDNKEENTFSEASPSGHMELQVSNKDALPFFVIGQKYYIDMTVKPAA